CAAEDLRVEPLARLRRQQLRIAQARDGPRGIEHDGCSRHGPGQAAAAHLVDARHPLEALATQGVLERAACRRWCHYPLGASGRRTSLRRAALPRSARRKYSLARRTCALRTTSILSITGEWSGKIRSTPWPNETLRTVMDARVPPRCIPMTRPSNTWMRSLSPSRTLTCTLTVSPGFTAGRSMICAASTASIGVMTALCSVGTGRRLRGQPCAFFVC